jgi:4-amino-4-deoxy-L-arabinose transferase-like glycosyltransferase
LSTQLAAPGTERPQAPNRLTRLALGPAGRPRWTRPVLCGVLVLAAVLYAWALSRNGYANSYYSAAVKSGTQSWKAFFFGSLDSASFITVDKPPMALWVMELTARIFGFGTWSLLLPQVVMGVAAVALLYDTVRRVFGPVAGVIAALVMTLTPITVAINRDNNPDTLLVLLLVLAAWTCQRALESGRPRWLLASAFFLGCGFNTKMLQAYLLLPALALVYLAFGSGGWPRRIGHLLAAGAVLVVSSFWWMVIVDLVPKGSRPYVGGSTNDTVWDLVIGYNGLGRVTGEGGMPGGRGGGGFAGSSGAGRMFNQTLAGQISWLLPFAAIALVAVVVLHWRRPRTDLPRAALLLWGGWLAVHFVVLSYSGGTMHPYYTTAMGPPIAALTGIGAVELFGARRRGRAWSGVLPLGVAVTGAWALVVLRRTPAWNPWLTWTVAALTAIAVIGLLTVRPGPRPMIRFAVFAAVAGLVAGLAGPAAYAVSAAGQRSNGTNPLAGPSAGGMGGFPGARGGMPGGGQVPARIRELMEERGFPGGPPGGARADGGQAPGTPSGQTGQTGQAGGPPAGGGGMDTGAADTRMVSYLEKNQGGATWLVAVAGSQSAASIILRTGKPVISMFGFTGSDRAMTVQKLQEYVRAGRLHYVMTGGGGAGGGGPGGGGPGGGSSAVTSWVTKNCAAVPATAYGGTSSSAGGGAALYRCG